MYIKPLDAHFEHNPDNNQSVIEFIKTRHYLKSMSKGNKHNFVLIKNNKIIAAATFAYPTKLNNNDGTLELKRFVMIDGKNNRCSMFLALCLRWLKTNTDYKKIITYADPEQKHDGTIYKASNFQFIGKQKYQTPYFLIDGKKVYSRNVYCNGKKSILYKNYIKEKGLTVKYAKAKYIFEYIFNR